MEIKRRRKCNISLHMTTNYATLYPASPDGGTKTVLIENMILYKDKYYIKVNEDTDTLFYFFDYDVRSSDINMQFQHFHTFYEICIMLCHDGVFFLEGTPPSNATVRYRGCAAQCAA